MRRTPLSDDDGASAVEYGLLIAAIAGVLVIVVFALGVNVTALFTDSCNEVAGKAAPATTC